MKNFLFFILMFISVVSFSADFNTIYKKANADLKAENYADAFKAYEQVLFAKGSDAFPEIGNVFSNAVEALLRLGKAKDFDSFFEKAVNAHPDNWRLLESAACELRQAMNLGVFIDGKFKRDDCGDFNSGERDRCRAINMLLKSVKLMKGRASAVEEGRVYLNLATALLHNRDARYSWKLMSLTDLNKCPEIEKDEYRDDYRKAPADKDGKPVFYKLPESFESAQNDGERFRWAVTMAEKKGSQDAPLFYACFLEGQFGARSLIDIPDRSTEFCQEKGPYSLYSLADDEAIAEISTGVSRFKLPDDSNFIRIYKDAAAYDKLADVYLDRRQYEKAADALRKYIATATGDAKKEACRTLEQITGNVGTFLASASHASGQKARFGFKFRNAKEIKLSARRIELDRLFADYKKFFISKSLKNKQDSPVPEIQDLIKDPEYLGKTVAEWTQKLEPAPHHWVRDTVIETPFTEAGAYLVEGKLENGSTSRMIIWIESMVLVRKEGFGRNIFIACDAASGAPLADAEIELFCHNEDDVWDFFVRTDKNGVVNSFDSDSFEKLVIATTKDGRLAFFGPTYLTIHNNPECHSAREFCITDRPVYRPGDTVKFKVWFATPSYLEEGAESSRESVEPVIIVEEDKASSSEGDVDVEVYDPAGTTIVKRKAKSDKWNGIDMEFKIPENAKLGVYSISHWGTFRVEEYKKPEFEVLVDTATEVLKHGCKITATIKARYYFGAPVSNAKVKYTVSAGFSNKRWIPTMQWAWLYGEYSGYFADFISEYRDSPFLKELFGSTVDIKPDGTVKIEIESKIEDPPSDYQEYRIDAEVTDASRRTVYGSGSVVVSTKPFNVYLWSLNGYFNSGDTVNIYAASKTEKGIPVTGKGTVKLLQVTYDKDGKPVESLAETWPLDIGDSGENIIKLKAAKPGQFKLVYTVTDSKNNSVDGSYSFKVFGDAATAETFKFKDLELSLDKSEYAVGEEVNLMITSSHKDAYVYLFPRAREYSRPLPELIRLNGHTAVKKIRVEDSDMPNFFVEAMTVFDNAVYNESKEILVPPEKKVLNVEVSGAKPKVGPGAKAKLKIRITDPDGKPVVGQTVVTVYDKSLEYISGGSNVPPILLFFWDWKRSLYPSCYDSIRGPWNISEPGDKALSSLGNWNSEGDGGSIRACALASPVPGRVEDLSAPAFDCIDACAGEAESECAGKSPLAPTVSIREYFADTAYWTYGVVPDKNGEVFIDVVMPENLSTWKVKAWTMAAGCRVGEGQTEIITSKDFIVRLEAPRFFVEGDEVVLSAVIHNYHDEAKKGTISIALEGDSLALLGSPAKCDIDVSAASEKRIDWRVKAVKEGRENITMAAGVEGDSDGVKMSLPVLVHGMKKQVSFSGFVPADKESGSVTFAFEVPEKRRAEASLFTVKCRPTLAGVLTDALPYLVKYPYGCTEQTLNSFLPAVIVREAIADLDVMPDSPELDSGFLLAVVDKGMKKLLSMQSADGGWGWFAGCPESSAHLTSIVMHGLKIASESGISVDASVMERGKKYLLDHQARRIKEIDEKKSEVDDIDALVFSTLSEYGDKNESMKKLLFGNRKALSLYGKSLFALGLDPEADREMLDALMRNIEQYLVRDSENQTAFLDTPRSCWWFWFNDDIETQANYLSLLMKFKPDSDVVPGLVKYLVCNRKNATYWKSTRDTAYCIEALLEYFKKSGEKETDMDVEILLDGKIRKTVKLDKGNLFSSDASSSIAGSDIKSGKHIVEIRKKGKGRLYCDASFSYFSLEDFIKAEGLDLKVRRNYYLLKKKDDPNAGFEKVRLDDLATVRSGEDVEVELVIESKNDYEYMLFEDMKPAGFECPEVRSGYTDSSLGAYVEYRDTKVAFFVSYLPRGTHNLIYRLRAETPGKFSALPARGEAMYSPELKANSNEMKIGISE